MAEATITSKGQITIPVEIRKKENESWTARQGRFYFATQWNHSDASEKSVGDYIGRYDCYQ